MTALFAVQDVTPRDENIKDWSLRGFGTQKEYKVRNLRTKIIQEERRGWRKMNYELGRYDLRFSRR
jgi:hypothetical protein